MADLYARLKALRDQKQLRERQAHRSAHPDGKPSSESATTDDEGSPNVVEHRAMPPLSPGADWTAIAHGVYERTVVHPLPFGVHGIDREGRWAGLSPLLRVPAGRRALFLDVETSGLSGGAGSTAFLIGLGDVSTAGDGTPADATPAVVTVRQLFLSEPSAESAMLERFRQVVGDSEAVMYVTYNGSSFDLPVLRTRHIMNRMRLPEAVHWDLLHLTRRLFAPVVGSVTLGRVEQLVLGAGRRNDVPGSEVPERYHRFLRTGDRSVIEAVVAHHFYDIAHLAQLGGLLNSIVSADGTGDGDGGGSDGGADTGSPVATPSGDRSREDPPGSRPRVPPDRTALARFLIQRGGVDEMERAVELLESVIEETALRRTRAHAAVRAGGLARRLAAVPTRSWLMCRELRAVVGRRRGEWGRVAELRRELFQERRSRHDLVEYAKVLEHRVGDVSAAAEIITAWADGAPLDDALAHRLARLERKRTGRTG